MTVAKTFYDYIGEKFWEAHPEALDDESVDMQADWEAELDPCEVMVWAQEWHDEVVKQGGSQ